MGLNLKARHSTQAGHVRKVVLDGEELTIHIRKLPSSKLRKVLAESASHDVEISSRAGNVEMAEAIRDPDDTAYTAKDFEGLPLREWNVLFKAFMSVQAEDESDEGNA